MTQSKVLYTAKAHTSGGREGSSRTDDNRSSVELSNPGTKATGTNRRAPHLPVLQSRPRQHRSRNAHSLVGPRRRDRKSPLPAETSGEWALAFRL